MPASLYDNFRIYNLNNFINSVNTNSIYLFTGRSKSWDDENNPPNPIDNQQYSTDAFDQIIALKKITFNDLIPVIQRNNWVSGKIYDMYRPNYTLGNSEGGSTRYPLKLTSNGFSSLNYGSNYYVMNEFYQVYKCLYNGETPENPNGVPSTVVPTGIGTTPFVTSDGYRWKYLFTVPTFYVLNFLNESYIPIPYPNTAFPQESAITNSAVNGSIDTVVIKNRGSGYTNGNYTNIPIRGDGVGGTVRINISSGRINTVTITSAGSGYTYGKIDLSLEDVGSGLGADIEVVIPPTGGHGFNISKELGAYRLMIHTNISLSDINFPVDTAYRRIGLIANPIIRDTNTIATSSTLNGYGTITFTSTTGSYVIGEVIRQNDTNATGVVLSWDEDTNTLKYYQDRFDGVYQGNRIDFSGANVIKGLSSLTEGTPNQYTLLDIEKNGGDILYLDNRFVINRSQNQIEDVKIVVEF